MGASNFLGMPPFLKVVVVLMFWPVLWGGALMILAVAQILIRHAKNAKGSGAPWRVPK